MKLSQVFESALLDSILKLAVIPVAFVPFPTQFLPQHWKDRLVSLLLMKMIVCCASTTCFQFHLYQFVCRLAEDIFSYLSAAILVALVLSYLTITCHKAYKTLSDVYYFNI